MIDPFTFLKITDDPIRFYLCGLYVLIFTVLESKTKKHLKDKNTHTHSISCQSNNITTYQVDFVNSIAPHKRITVKKANNISVIL